MRCGFVPLVYICCLLWTRQQVKAVDSGVNAQEFGVLCRIYGLAAKQVELTGFPTVNLVKNLVHKIERLSWLASENETLIGQVREEKEEDEVLKRLSEPTQRALVRGKLERLLVRARRTSATIEATRTRTQDAISAAKQALRKAIYGDDAPKEGDITVEKQTAAIFGSTESNLAPNKNCGGDGARGDTTDSQYVGRSLINDFFCLCVALNGASNDKHCAKTVTKASGGSWASNYAKETTWKAIRDACPAYDQNTTAQSIESALLAFHSILGAQAKTATDTNAIAGYIFGKPAGTLASGCTSTDTSPSTNGVCVNYAQRLGGKKPGIPWEKNMIEAQKMLRSAEEEKRAVQILLNSLQHLKDNAVDDYKEVEYQAQMGHSDGRNSSAGLVGSKGFASSVNPRQAAISSSNAALDSAANGKNSGMSSFFPLFLILS